GCEKLKLKENAINIQGTMTNIKNSIPIYEEQQIINEETASIQKILNQFKQPIPDEFTELGQPKKH
ncbi:9097_t:CDS:1, partial [Ambispora leptoticha]